jgi:hypothetical protein
MPKPLTPPPDPNPITPNTPTHTQVLEPLAEEIAALKAQEEGEGLTAQATIQYKLDKRTLGTIHLNAITRIYGDHGLEVRGGMCKGDVDGWVGWGWVRGGRSQSATNQPNPSQQHNTQTFQVLELLRKNPAGAIPVVLRRLKQKDLEWRKARQVREG